MSYKHNLRERFIKSGALTIFGAPLEKLLEEEEDSLPKGSDELLKKNWAKNYFSRKIHRHGCSGVIARRLNEVKGKLGFLEDSEEPKIFVYGAGSQTLRLLEIWKLWSLPPINGIAVTEAEEDSNLLGCPIFSIESVVGTNIDLILLSSKSFEAEMAACLDDKLPSVPRLSFWIKELTKL